MTILDTRRELKNLKTACQQLMERIELCQEGARYRRKKSRRSDLSREIKQALSYIEMATEALDGDGERAPEPSWLRGTMSRLSHALVKDTQPTDADAEAEACPETPELQGEGDFQGNTKALSIPDLLHILRAQVQTGVLQVVLEEETVFIEFEEGDVVHAYSQNAPTDSKLGEILVDRGDITRERLDSFLFCYTPSRGMFGEALKQGELVTEAQLKAALEDQIQRLFNRMFEHGGADFWFQHGRPTRADGGTRMNVIGLLLESARMQDEANTPG